MSKKVLYSIVVATLIILGMTVWLVTRNNRPASAPVVSNSRVIENKPLGYTFTLDNVFLQGSAEDNTMPKGAPLEFYGYKKATTTEEAATISIFVEEGLAAPTNLLKKTPLQIITENSTKTLQTKYAQYQELKKNQITIASKQSLEVVFSYQSGRETVTQRLIGIPIDADRVLYVRFQSINSRFEENNEQYFNPVLESFVFN